MSQSVNVLKTKGLVHENSAKIPVFVDGIKTNVGTTAQRTAATVSAGAFFYDTTLESMYFYDSGAWHPLDAPPCLFVNAAATVAVANDTEVAILPTGTSVLYEHRIATEDDATGLYFYPCLAYGDGLVNIRGTWQAGTGNGQIRMGGGGIEMYLNTEVDASNDTEFTMTISLSELVGAADVSSTQTGISFFAYQNSGVSKNLTNFKVSIVQFGNGINELGN